MQFVDDAAEGVAIRGWFVRLDGLGSWEDPHFGNFLFALEHRSPELRRRFLLVCLLLHLAHNLPVIRRTRNSNNGLGDGFDVDAETVRNLLKLCVSFSRLLIQLERRLYLLGC